MCDVTRALQLLDDISALVDLRATTEAQDTIDALREELNSL